MLLKPDWNLENIYQIDLSELEKSGIKAIFFDLDSTIMVSKSGKFLPETLDWLKNVCENFYVAVVSNNKKEEYITKVKACSDFDVFGNANKPSPKLMREIVEKRGLKPNQVVMVGDRPLTDILAGKLLGCKTILVGSINAKNEGVLTCFVRWLERRFIKY